jgi:hypothetical protein
VDHLWQVILTSIFRFEQGYLVVGRDRVDHGTSAADIILKHLRDKKSEITTILTMSNKRQGSGNKIWKDAAK